MVKVNGVEYHEDRILYPVPSVVGKLFDAPSVGNARARTLTLNLMPYDGPQGHIPPMSEILLFVRLKSADGERVSEYIQKGVFYADEVRRDSVTGATRITAFDAMMKMERQFGNAVCRITFDDGFGGIQRYLREIGEAMPTPDRPMHDGERFLSWYPNPADTQSVIRDMLFTANWAQKFTVTFDSGNGMPQMFSVFNGDATPTPTIPTKSGYLFTEWTPTPAATVTADATYTAQWASMTSVIITAYPAKTAYFVGDTLDYTGLAVTASYSDGTTQDVTAECVISPAEGTEITEPGDIMIDVRYNGKSLGTFWVAALTLQSIVITSYPTKTTYSIGDALDYTGLAVTAHFSNGDEQDITADCTLSPVAGTEVTEVGTITVTVNYRDKAATFDMTAATIIASGDWWTLYDNGFLDIYCVGDMPNYQPYPNNKRPWNRFIDKIQKVTIENCVTSIGSRAFTSCVNLTGIAIPSSVTSLGSETFRGCSRLTDITIPDSVTDIASNVFERCSALTNITIPDSVTSLGRASFKECSSLNSVKIGSGLTTINSDMFEKCTGLTSVIIENGVKYLGEYVFWDCTSLSSVILPNTLLSIGKYAFYRCNALTNIVIPDSVTTIQQMAFQSNPALESITVESGNTKYVSENGILFSNDKTVLYCYPAKKAGTSYIIPDSVATIADGAFNGCAELTNITIPTKVTTIPSYGFMDCTGLASITILGNVVSIGMYAFRNTAFTSVTIPDGVRTIQNGAFHSCSNLTSVTIPNSVTYIRNYAFNASLKMKDVYYAGTEAQWSAITIDSDNEVLTSATIHYNSSGAS